MALAVLGSISSEGEIRLAAQANTRLKAPDVEMGLIALSGRNMLLGVLKGKGL